MRNGGRYSVKFRSAIKRRHWRRSESASGTHRPHYLSFILYVGVDKVWVLDDWRRGRRSTVWRLRKPKEGIVCVCTLQGFKRSPVTDHRSSITGRRWSDSALSAGQQWCQLPSRRRPGSDRQHSSFTRHVRATARDYVLNVER